MHEVIVPVCPLLVLAWSSESPRGQWRTGKNGENWMQNHLWCPNDPRGERIDDDGGDDDASLGTGSVESGLISLFLSCAWVKLSVAVM